MEETIKQVVLDLGYITADIGTEKNIQKNIIVKILEHPDDINFISENMTSDIDLLITYNKNVINVAISNNRDTEANTLATCLASKFNMRFQGNIDGRTDRPDFPFRVITIMNKL